LDTFGTLRVIFTISGTFLEQVVHWHTLEQGVTPNEIFLAVFHRHENLLMESDLFRRRAKLTICLK
jgi:hypothetical protein